MALAALAVLAAVVALPHALVRPPSPARTAELVRDVRLRAPSAELVARLGAAGSRADSVALGRALVPAALLTTLA